MSNQQIHTGHEAEMAALEAEDAAYVYNADADLKMVMDHLFDDFSATFGLPIRTAEDRLQSLEGHIARIRRNMAGK